MDNPGLFQQAVGDLLPGQLHIGAQIAVEGEAPLSPGVHGDHGQGGGNQRVLAEAGDIHPVALQHSMEGFTKRVRADPSHKGSLRSQPGSRNRHIGRGAAWIGRKMGNPFFIQAGLCQVNQHLADRRHCKCHKTSS